MGTLNARATNLGMDEYEIVRAWIWRKTACVGRKPLGRARLLDEERKELYWRDAGRRYFSSRAEILLRPDVAAKDLW